MSEMTEKEILDSMYKLACAYLLWERQEQTEMRTAFILMCQERHINYHTKKGKDDGSSFENCKNEKCIAAAGIANSAKDLSITINNLGFELVKDFRIRLVKEKFSCRVWLERKDEVPETEGEGLIIRV